MGGALFYEELSPCFHRRYRFCRRPNAPMRVISNAMAPRIRQVLAHCQSPEKVILFNKRGFYPPN